MKSDFRESKGKERRRRYFEGLVHDPDFAQEVTKIRDLMEQNGATQESERRIYELSKKHGIPIDGPLIQFIMDGEVKDYALFDACIVEFPYMDYANAVAAGQIGQDDYRLKSHLENFPIRIQVAADASGNEIKDCIAAHAKLIEGWQRFMPPKHWPKTRTSPSESRTDKQGFIRQI